MGMAFSMGEDMAGASESSSGQRRRMLWGLLSFQGLHQNAFHPSHIDEVHLQGPPAGGVQALGSVAPPQADELVALPDP